MIFAGLTLRIKTAVTRNLLGRYLSEVNSPIIDPISKFECQLSLSDRKECGPAAKVWSPPLLFEGAAYLTLTSVAKCLEHTVEDLGFFTF